MNAESNMQKCDCHLPITNAAMWSPVKFEEKLVFRSSCCGIFGICDCSLRKPKNGQISLHPYKLSMFDVENTTNILV